MVVVVLRKLSCEELRVELTQDCCVREVKAAVTKSAWAVPELCQVCLPAHNVGNFAIDVAGLPDHISLQELGQGDEDGPCAPASQLIELTLLISIAPLAVSLKDPHTQLRHMAVQTLRSIAVKGDPSIIGLLAECLRDPSKRVRNVALAALEAASLDKTQLDEQVVSVVCSCLKDRDPDVVCTALEALLRLASRSSLQDVALLGFATCLGHWDEDVRAVSKKALAVALPADAGGHAGVSAMLREHLKSADVDVQRTALEAMASVTPKAEVDIALGPVLVCFEAPNWRVRSSALSAAAALAPGRIGVITAIQRYTKDPDADVRVRAFEAMKPCLDYHDDLEDLDLSHVWIGLEDESPAVRIAAVRLLPALIASSSPKSTSTRTRAIRALILGLEDGNWRVRLAAMEALEGSVPEVYKAEVERRKCRRVHLYLRTLEDMAREIQEQEDDNALLPVGSGW